jgi:cytidylate kinase
VSKHGLAYTRTREDEKDKKRNYFMYHVDLNDFDLKNLVSVSENRSVRPNATVKNFHLISQDSYLTNF